MKVGSRAEGMRMKLEVLSKTEQVRRAILAEILSGRLRPGERLLEAQLSKELGYRRPPSTRLFRICITRGSSPSC